MKSTDIESEICICVKIESEIKELKMKSAVNFYLEIFLFLAKKFEQKCYKRFSCCYLPKIYKVSF